MISRRALGVHPTVVRLDGQPTRLVLTVDGLFVQDATCLFVWFLARMRRRLLGAGPEFEDREYRVLNPREKSVLREDGCRRDRDHSAEVDVRWCSLYHLLGSPD